MIKTFTTFNKKRLICLTICCFFSILESRSQLKNNVGFKVSGYYLFHSGTSFSIATGFWKTGKWFQPSTNLSFNLLFGPHNLGNNARKGTDFQYNLVLSPLLTTRISKNPYHIGRYEEINPFYFNNSSVVYTNYFSSITLGSSFVLQPRGFGSNYTTSRNRTQQLLVLQIKVAADFNKKNKEIEEGKGAGENNLKGIFGSTPAQSINKDDGSLEFNLIEDIGPGILSPFADNWDRFITGGGSLQLRVGQFWKFKLYSEVYTGTTARDFMDYPDIIKPQKHLIFNSNNRKILGPARPARYAIQEAAQKMFNNGRSIFCIEVDDDLFRQTGNRQMNNFANYNAKYSFYLVRQGGEAMWSQNLIHTWMTPGVEKVIEDKIGTPDNLNLKIYEKGDKIELERLHRFEPFYKQVRGGNPIKYFKRLRWGVGANYFNF